uniref:histidine kinase n=1 Tax=Cohnella candidum TaxID=2674991 RepID=A0A3G3K3I1_9BACL|nr:sensor histidine kinase [Cohnella candidum]
MENGTKDGDDRLASKMKPQWHWFVTVVIAMRAVWFVGGLNELHFQSKHFTETTGIHWDRSTIWLVTAGFALSFAVPLSLFLIRKVPTWVPPLAELVISGGMYLFYSKSVGGGFDFYNVPILTLGFISIRWSAVWSGIAGVVFMPVLAGWIWGFSLSSVGDEIFNLAVLFGIGFCFQRLVDSYQKINGMYGIIQEQNQTLELYSKQIEKLTLAEERNRLSRDLHDTVGHTFTTTIMGMDAVYYLIDLSPEEAKKSLRELLQVTRGGLDEVRRHIHQIAPEKDEQSLAAALGQIGSEFALHTGTAVEFDVIGAEYAVSEQVRWAFIRCLQESLTNAKKHGAATRVGVELSFGRSSVKLRIADNGRGTSELVRGFGLQAMHDRMANLNGTLEVESNPDRGTIVVCEVPVVKVGQLEWKREGA